MDHRSAHTATQLFFHLDRVGAADDPLLVPVEPMGSGFVGDPVLVGMPERTSFDDHDLPALASDALGQHGATRARSDDTEIDLVTIAVVAHRPLSGQIAAMHVEEMTGVVVLRTNSSL